MPALPPPRIDHSARSTSVARGIRVAGRDQRPIARTDRSPSTEDGSLRLRLRLRSDKLAFRHGLPPCPCVGAHSFDSRATGPSIRASWADRGGVLPASPASRSGRSARADRRFLRPGYPPGRAFAVTRIQITYVRPALVEAWQGIPLLVQITLTPQNPTDSLFPL